MSSVAFSYEGRPLFLLAIRAASRFIAKYVEYLFECWRGPFCVYFDGFRCDIFRAYRFPIAKFLYIDSDFIFCHAAAYFFDFGFLMSALFVYFCRRDLLCRRVNLLLPPMCVSTFLLLAHVASSTKSISHAPRMRGKCCAT